MSHSLPDVFDQIGRNYRVVPEWPKMPAGWDFVEATAVAVDRNDRVFVFNRGEHSVAIFDADGNSVGSWGEDTFVRPHGITIDGDVCYLIDDEDHTVHKYTLDGTLLQTIGNSGKPSDTGAKGVDYRTIERVSGPFNFPTNLAIASNGDLYIADGYGNARVHQFSEAGKLIKSWGEIGDGPGQFHVPHGIAIDGDDVIYIADRENSRIQRFDTEGTFLGSWDDIPRPCQLVQGADGLFYVAELGFRSGRWPGWPPMENDAIGGRVSIRDHDGQVVHSWGGGLNPCEPGDFFAAHDIAIDSTGAIYVAEVTWSAGGRLGLVPKTCPSIQKFIPD